MSSEDTLRTFHRLIFLLNASFPVQSDGEPLLEKWKQCDLVYPQIMALIGFFKERRDFLGQPILLAELIRRCSW